MRTTQNLSSNGIESVADLENALVASACLDEIILSSNAIADCAGLCAAIAKSATVSTLNLVRTQGAFHVGMY